MKSWFSGERQKRLCDVARDRVKPRSFAGGQDNGFHKHRYLERCAMDGASMMHKIAFGWAPFAALCCCGCGGDVRAELTLPVSPAEITQHDRGFDIYVSAAEEMEQKGAKHIGRTAWTPDQRDFIVAAAAGPIAKIAGAPRPRFGKTWQEPFGPRPYTRGWRTIGRALVWRLEAAVKNVDLADARFCMITAMKMSNALETSDAHDADLGLAIADECAHAVWPHVPRFGAGELSSLSKDLLRLLDDSPNPSIVVSQEKSFIARQVEWVHERYQERDFTAISETLGQAVQPAVKFLRELAEEPPAAQQAYFDCFVRESESDLRFFERRVSTAPHEWQGKQELGTRAWMRFTESFGTPWRVYVERRAEIRTRIKLLAIDAALLAKFKAKGSVPSDLREFPGNLRKDPYSGRDFVYVPRGGDYKLYSVGPDKADDGGDHGDIAPDR